MRWDRTRNSDRKLVDNRSVLHMNSRCRIEGIPDDTHLYNVNGKIPLEWAIGRLRMTTDKAPQYHQRSQPLARMGRLARRSSQSIWGCHYIERW